MILVACSGSHEGDAAVDTAHDGGVESGVDAPLEVGMDVIAPNDGGMDTSAECELVAVATDWEQASAIGTFGRRGVRGVVTLGSGNVAIVGSDVSGGGRVEIYQPFDDRWTGLGTNLLLHNSTTRLRSGRAFGVGSGALWTWTEPRDRFITQDVAILVDDDATIETNPPRLSRMVHASVLLDDDRVMIAGGWHAEYAGEPGGDTVGRVLVEAEAYDEDAESWVDLAPLNDARWAFSLTRLGDGRVLAAGGFDSAHSPLASAEIYDPESNTWTATGSMSSPRAWHEAQPLPSAGVLVMGGYTSSETFTATAEVFDPTTGAWSTVPGLPAPFAHAASVALSSGRVVLAGGYFNDEEFRVYDTVFLFDEGMRCWQSLPPLNTGRFHFGLAEVAPGAVFAGPGRTVDGATDVPERAVIE